MKERITTGLAAALLAVLLAVNVYRARTQSIVHDEAFTYSEFISAPFPVIFTYFSANNHLLHTLLAKASVKAFGVSEFTLRLPSLLGGAFFMAGVFALCRLLLGSGWLFLFCVATLALNPFILDFLSAARGYGMALAFWTWAAVLMIAAPRRPAAQALAGSLLGLSVAANLTFAFPGTALALMAAFSLAVIYGPGRGAVAPVLRFVLPGIALAALLLAVPLSHARRENFYVGMETLSAAAENLIESSLSHHQTGGKDSPPAPWIEKFKRLLRSWIAPIVLAASAICLILIPGNWRAMAGAGGLRQTEFGMFLIAGSLLLTVVLLAAAYHGFGLLYPEGRTGLYLFLLFVLFCFALAGRLAGLGRLYAAAAAALLLVMAICLAIFVEQFNVSRYMVWEYDAGTRGIVNRITDVVRSQPPPPGRQIKLGVTWVMAPSLNYYRQVYRLDWMEPVAREGPEAGEFDYYVLTREDSPLAEKLKLKRLYEDPVSGTFLAVR